MSYSIYLQRFSEGKCVDLDTATFWRIVSPHVAYQEPQFNYVHLAAVDGGEAGLFVGSDDGSPLESVTIERFSRGDVLEVIARLVQALDAVLLLPEGIVLVADSRQGAHLPADLQEFDVRVIARGSDIEHVWSAA